jgi:hypothetical protein
MTDMQPPRGISHWAGFRLDRPLVMGVINVTPDSFSDGGRRTDVRDAIATGLAMAADGADIVDIGGESTRPGAAAVPPDGAGPLPVGGHKKCCDHAGSARGRCQDRQRRFGAGA